MTFRALPLVAVAALGLIGSPLSADVIREATGQRRAELDKMELQAFPADAWGKVSHWINGDGLTGAATADKPVLIVTWASWNRASLKGLQLGQKMADKFGKQGLIVVGIHSAQGWDDAEKIAKEQGVKFLLAHDAESAFHKALKIDHDPEYYVIDRAGHLRYAAISPASVDEAVTELAGETPVQANDLPRILKERADQEAAKGRKLVDIRGSVDLANLPAVPPGYSRPPEAAFKAAEWPNIDSQLGKDFGLIDQQSNKRLEPKLTFTPAGYYPSKPETEGRAQVIYFWNPDMLVSYDRVMGQMDLLQQQHSRDLAVIGAMIPVAKLDAQRANDPNAQEDPAKLQKKYQSFIGARNFRHALAADINGTSIGSLAGQSGSTKIPVPGAMIVSSDGVIRWMGSTSGTDFRYALDTVLANDPGVQARRAADQKYIQSAAK